VQPACNPERRSRRRAGAFIDLRRDPAFVTFEKEGVPHARARGACHANTDKEGVCVNAQRGEVSPRVRVSDRGREHRQHKERRRR
jgi:hypothetical protein